MYRTVATGHESAQNLKLKRGQYRVSMTVPYDGPPEVKEHFTRRIDNGSELQRVYFYKVDVRPVGLDEETEEPVAKVTAVFRVLDNVLPLVPIAWGLTAAVTGASGWFFLDKVERVTTNPLALLPILGVIVTLILFAQR